MLINPADLGDWMFGANRATQYDAARGLQAIRVAESWLLDATRIDPWPTDPNAIAEDLRGWLLELSALAYVNNPKSLVHSQTGSVGQQWAPDGLAQRQAILDRARARYNTAGQPRGCFPPARRWPDEADRRCGWVYYR